MKTANLPNVIKTVLFSLIFTAFQFTACKESTGTKRSILSGTYKIEIQKSVFLPEDGDKATLTFVEFKDNRCPPNANCVNAGSANVTVLFKDDKINEQINLCLGDDCSDEVKTFTSGGIKYSISLIELTPYALPGVYIFTAPPKITVVVKKI